MTERETLVGRRSRRSHGPLFLGWEWGWPCDLETCLFEHATFWGKGRTDRGERHDVGAGAARQGLERAFEDDRQGEEADVKRIAGRCGGVSCLAVLVFR